MFFMRPRNFRPAIFTCNTIGCSKSFKSEAALKRHQTAVHVIPDALRPSHPHHEPCQEHTAVEFPNEVGLSQDEAPIPNLPYHDGFHIKTHPILDGECYASSSCNGVLNMCQLLH